MEGRLTVWVPQLDSPPKFFQILKEFSVVCVNVWFEDQVGGFPFQALHSAILG